MKIVYPYNEILPIKSAHDCYIYQSCAHLAAIRPEIVMLSVRKQGAFHLKRKIEGVRYLFEVQFGFYHYNRMSYDFFILKKVYPIHRRFYMKNSPKS